MLANQLKLRLADDPFRQKVGIAYRGIRLTRSKRSERGNDDRSSGRLSRPESNRIGHRGILRLREAAGLRMLGFVFVHTPARLLPQPARFYVFHEQRARTVLL